MVELADTLGVEVWRGVVDTSRSDLFYDGPTLSPGHAYRWTARPFIGDVRRPVDIPPGES